MEETDFSVISNDCSIDTVNSKISFRVPEVVKGSKNKRAKNAVEKNTGKKRKSSSDKDTYPLISLLLLAAFIFIDAPIQSKSIYC
jgi:hypothetical protein